MELIRLELPLLYTSKARDANVPRGNVPVLVATRVDVPERVLLRADLNGAQLGLVDVTRQLPATSVETNVETCMMNILWAGIAM